MHILLADADLSRRATLRDALQAAGHRVSEADTAVAAQITLDNEGDAVHALVIAESLPVIRGAARKREFSWSVMLVARHSVPGVKTLMMLDTDDVHTRDRAFACRIECMVRGEDELGGVLRWAERVSPKPRNVIIAPDSSPQPTL